MKPFNLELAKQGHPVQTADGTPVRIVCYDRKGAYPLLALLDNGNRENSELYRLDGSAANDREDLQLVMAREKREMWINIYKNVSGNFFSGHTICYSEEEAKLAVNLNFKYAATVKVEWED